jgi:hypothetical protein
MTLDEESAIRRDSSTMHCKFAKLMCGVSTLQLVTPFSQGWRS